MQQEQKLKGFQLPDQRRKLDTQLPEFVKGFLVNAFKTRFKRFSIKFEVKMRKISKY